MQFFIGTIKLALGCVALWAAVAWFGTGAVALALAILATLSCFMGLDSANRHGAELQRLRERLRGVEENLGASHDRLQTHIDALEERVRRLDQRIDALTPWVASDDD